MPNKDFKLDDDLTVTVYKRKGNRSLRLSIAPGGQIRVSIPAWAPYRAGVNFANSRQSWIRAQKPTSRLLIEGQAIGKAHHLQFIRQSGLAKPTSRIGTTAVLIRYPGDFLPDSLEVQKIAQEACIRALRRQAEQLLPQRLAYLADKHKFKYGSVSVKRLKGRWGSCDQHGDIVLNLFLMQLPWELIDYVLLHELTHTVVLRHGPDFWQRLGDVLPDHASLKKAIREYKPIMSGMA